MRKSQAKDSQAIRGVDERVEEMRRKEGLRTVRTDVGFSGEGTHGPGHRDDGLSSGRTKGVAAGHGLRAGRRPCVADPPQ